jgi:hypothetical protein
VFAVHAWFAAHLFGFAVIQSTIFLILLGSIIINFRSDGINIFVPLSISSKYTVQLNWKVVIEI